MKRIRLLLCDDSYEVIQQYSHHFANQPAFEIVGVAYNGREAYEKTFTTRPDVVLLDMLMPVMDGLGYLESLRREEACRQQHVIVISGIAHERYHRQALALGADYYLLKPCDMRVVQKRIERVMSNDDTAMEKKDHGQLMHQIQTALFSLGFKPDMIGYQYLAYAFLKIIYEHGLPFSVTKDIYPQVADHFSTSESSVEKSIRLAVHTAYSQEDRKLQAFLSARNANDGCPGNSRFMKMVLDQLRAKLF